MKPTVMQAADKSQQAAEQKGKRYTNEELRG